MTKRLSWWKYLAAKIDDRLEAKRRKQEYSRGFVEIYHAALILFVATYLLIFNYDRMVVMLILVTLSLLGFGIRDYWIYRRRVKHEYHPDPLEVETQLGDLSIYKPDPLPTPKLTAAATLEIADATAPTASMRTNSPPSITEQTTERLDRNTAKDTS